MKNRHFVSAVRVAIFSALFYQTTAMPAKASAQEIPADTSVNGELKVHLDALKGFSDDDTTKIDQAAAVMEKVLNSDDFRQAVIGFTYQNKPQFSNNEIADAGGHTIAHDMTNQQIYDTLMASRETYLNNTDLIAHLNLTLYSPPFYKKWSVVGYGYPGKPQIFMNQNYFNSYSVADVAGNIAHEWTHKLGFDHDYNRTPNRPYSVPYAIGCIVEKLGGSQATSDCGK